MPKKLFVGSLSFNTGDAGLRAAFERYGAVSEAKVVLERETGRSRGFGFVSFNDGAQADAAIKGLDGSTLDGRTIRVNEAEAKPRDDRGGGGRGGGGGGGGYGGGGGRDDRSSRW